MPILLLILLTAVRIVGAQPGVQTLDATNITDTSAQLNGLVSPNGMETHWTFAYYRESDNKFLGWCPEPSGVLLGLGQAVTSNAVPVSCQINDLEPITSYSFFLNAQWVGDTWQYGALLYFTTSPTQMATISTIYTNILTFTSATYTTSQPTVAGFDFTLSVSPSALSVKQGDSAHYTVSLTYSSPSYAGTVINIQLAGLGPGMNWDITQTGDLTITTAASTPPSTYPIFLTGSANGVTHQTAMTLIVTSNQAAMTSVMTTTALTTFTSSSGAASFDFSVTVSPSTQFIEVGGSTSFVVSVLPLAGNPLPVSLTVVGLPGDVHSSFTTASGTPPYSSKLNLDVSTSSANAGTYTVTVVAASAGNVKTATATLTIQRSTAQTAATGPIPGGLFEQLEENKVNIIVGLLALAVVLALLVMRGRRQHGSRQQSIASQIFCSKCGTANPTSNEFCRNCGNKTKTGQV